MAAVLLGILNAEPLGRLVESLADWLYIKVGDKFKMRRRFAEGVDEAEQLGERLLGEKPVENSVETEQ